MNTLVLTISNLHIILEMSSFIHVKDIMEAKNLKMGRKTLTMPILG